VLLRLLLLWLLLLLVGRWSGYRTGPAAGRFACTCCQPPVAAGCGSNRHGAVAGRLLTPLLLWLVPVLLLLLVKLPVVGAALRLIVLVVCVCVGGGGLFLLLLLPPQAPADAFAAAAATSTPPASRPSVNTSPL
jgi:hypothetical protein